MAASILLTSVSDRPATCRGCRRPIMWARTAKGRNIALEAKAPVRRLSEHSYEISSDFVHWAVCPSAAKFRAQNQRRPSEGID